MSHEFRGPAGFRKTLGEFTRALEIGIIGTAAGIVYGLYGGLINWWPFGFDPHWPQPQYIIVYLMSFGIAIFVDMLAHPRIFMVIREEIARRGED